MWVWYWEDIVFNSKRKGTSFLLDYSSKALLFSKKFFELKKVDGFFQEGTIFKILYQNDTFDVVWNAGVLEHFPEEKQVDALCEMKRVCKKNGLVVTFNPFAKGYIYRIGKFFGEKRGVWPFGDEFPVRSLRDLASTVGLEVVREYSFGFNMQLSFLKYTPLGWFIRRILTSFINESIGRRLFNGYLLVSIFKK